MHYPGIRCPLTLRDQKLALPAMRSFCTSSIQYPSGSRTNATFFMRPSVSLFFQLTLSDSRRAQAASMLSTEMPRGITY